MACQARIIFEEEKESCQGCDLCNPTLCVWYQDGLCIQIYLLGYVLLGSDGQRMSSWVREKKPFFSEWCLYGSAEVWWVIGEHRYECKCVCTRVCV